ncbi:MAG: hypothetical protein JWO93_1778 [Micrococcaceae bacterium]|jgi:hypothetical protein|nr:hypothetical protein [Micrococcaceae bacterium]
MKNRAEEHGTGTHAGSSAVHSITDARTAHTDEMRQRMIKYAVAMGIRVVCLGMLFVLDGWLKLIAIAGAVFLPWFAVIIANGGSDTLAEHSTALLDNVPLPELEAPRPMPSSDTTTVLQGEVVAEDRSTGAETGTGAGASTDRNGTA